MRGFMPTVALWVVAGALLAGVAVGEPWWIAYEGDDLPECRGWTRYWGNWQGEYQGPGAYRTINTGGDPLDSMDPRRHALIEDGVITYDSLYDAGVFDLNRLYRKVDPTGPSEQFVAEWRVRVRRVVRGHDDPNIVVFSDTAKAFSFRLSEDSVTSGFDPTLKVSIVPYIFHSYRMESSDMLTYRLYVDGKLVHEGPSWQGVTKSRVGWGDGTQGAASLHDWDYVRVIPKPIPEPAGLMLMICALCSGRPLRR
jgi:hypothetical protein